jgi:hypothetical protein
MQLTIQILTAADSRGLLSVGFIRWMISFLLYQQMRVAYEQLLSWRRQQLLHPTYAEILLGVVVVDYVVY